MVSQSFLQFLLAYICVEQLRGLALLPEETQNPETINLYSVSTSQFMETSNLDGSKQGGTSLYLKAIGFDSIITNNIIFVGKYSCIIDETFVKEQELSCKTTAPLLNDNSLQNLLVTVEASDNKKSVCTSLTNNCLFSYKQQKSPYLHYLIPSIGFANSVLSSKGEWTLIGEEHNEIEKILIGQKSCIKNQYRLLNTQMQKDEDVISCQLAEDLISSTYQVNVGTRRGNILSQKSFKMLPLISSLKWSYETNDSFILNINGYGFKSGLAENIVKISGTDVSITVLEVSTNQLKVQIPKITDQTILDSMYGSDSVFISGTGLFYTKYDFRGLTNQYTNCDVFRNDIISDSQDLKARIIQNGVYSQPDYIDEVESQYGQYFRGFFKATQSGEYQFLLAADDYATFYIQTAETLKPIHAESPAASSSQSTQYRNYYGEQLWDNQKVVNSISQIINLEENKYYYIEIFHINNVGKGFLTLSMNAKISELQAPNTKQSQLFQVKTSYIPQNEIQEINIYNSQENVLLLDTFKLKFKDSNQEQLSFITQDITLNFNSDQIQQALLDCCNYLTQVKINKLDYSGLVLDDTSETYAGHQYLITYLSHRGQIEDRYLPVLISIQESFIFNVRTTQEPLDPISGSFKLSLLYQSTTQIFVDQNNNQELSYDVDPSILADNFYRLIGEKPIVWTEGRSKDGQIWNILFTSCANIIQNFKSEQNNLQSGNGNVNLEVQNIKTCNSQLYEPIPALKLFTYGTKPQVQVSTSEGQGACEQEGVCDFSFEQTKLFILSSYSISNQNMALSFSIQTQEQFILVADDFTIEFRGAVCIDIKIVSNDSNLFKLICTLETQNAEVIAEAGTNQYPIIFNKLYGYIRRDTSVIAASTVLEFNSIVPNSASPDGGAEITILGFGFPKDLSRKFVLKMGNTQINPLTISNKKIVFIHPPGTDGTIKIEFNGNIFSDVSFTYDAAYKLTITKLSSTIISPFFRDTLQVIGTNFGTVLQDIKAFIQNKEIQVVDVQDQLLTVKVNVSLDTFLSKIMIQRKQYGQIQTSITVDLQITHITPNSSTIRINQFGSYLVKISGSNFLNGPSIITFNSVNPQTCEITQRNATYIVCSSPPKILDVQSGGFRLIQNFKHVVTCSQCKYEYIPFPEILSVKISDIVIPHIKYQPKYLMLWSQEAKIQKTHPLLFYKQSQFIDSLLSYDQVWSKTILNFTPGQVVQLQFILSATASLDFITKIATMKLSFTQNGQTKYSIKTQSSGQLALITVPSLTQGLHLTSPVQSYYVSFIFWYTRFGLEITSVSDATIGGGLIIIKGYGFNELYLKNIQVEDKECQEIKVISSVEIQCFFKTRLLVGQNTLTLNQFDQENQDTLLTRTFAINIKEDTISPKVSKILVDGIDKLDATRNSIVHNPGTFKLKIEGVNLLGQVVVVQLLTNTEIITGVKTTTTQTQTLIEYQFSNIPIGTYLIEIKVGNYYASYVTEGYVNLILEQSQAPTLNNPSISRGGIIINISGEGFSTNPLSNLVQFCDLPCKVISSSFNSLEVIAPMLFTSQLIQSMPYSKITLKELIISGDRMEQVQNIYDEIISTDYSSDSQTQCFIQFNLKAQFAYLKLAKLRFQPKLGFEQNKLKTIKIQYTIDGQNWISLEQLKYINEGWNVLIPEMQIDKITSIKFIDDQGIQGSQCSFSEIELYGWIYQDENNLQNCQLDINVNGIQLSSISNAETFSYQHQPIVESVVPKYGPVNTETLITIKGNGFIIDQTTVTIDNIQCVLVSVTTTEITCKTGIKTVLTENSGFIVQVQKAQALIKQQFMYIQKWSDVSTWEFQIPQDEDSVLIKNYQKVLLDFNTVLLDRLVIEGTLIFADDQDIKLIANSIIIREGSLIIGSQDQPYQHQAIIMLRGQESDMQFPLIGNKVIGCVKCQIQMFGRKRTPSWSLLDQKVLKGDSIIKLSTTVDWNVGEQIVIATSSSNIEENEIRMIKFISSDKKSITLDQPLSYTHLSEVQYKTEVGLLSRNILIQAEQQNNYGVHIHINGRQNEGTVVKISNVEIKYGGQTNIIGRYPIHFYNNEEMDQSLIEDNSIYNSYSRCIVLNNVKYLRVINNVCFNIIGNAIHLVSVTDIYNRIESNLVIKVKSNQYIDNSCSFFNFQTRINQLQDIDRQSSAFYISNPHNIVINNRAISSDYIGFNIFINRINNHNHQIVESLGWDVLNIQNNFIHSIVGHGIQLTILLETQQQLSANQYNVASILKQFSIWENIYNDFNLVIRTQTEIIETQFNFPNAETVDLNIISSSNFASLLNPLIFKFTYSLNNENFHVYRFRDKEFKSLLEIPNEQNCQMGDWYNDQITKSLYVCILGQQKMSKQPIKINGQICIDQGQCNFASDNSECPKILLNETNDDQSQDNSEAQDNSNTEDTDNTNDGNTDGNTNTDDGNNTNTDDNTNTDGNTNTDDANTNTDDGNTNTDDNTSNDNTNNDNTNNDNTNNTQGYNIYNWSSPLAWKPNQIPKRGEKVTIKKGNQIILDIDPPELDELIIDGILIFDEKRQESILQSSSIIINQGQIIAGNKEQPYKSKITIKSLNIQVFNSFELYSTIPQTFNTRLVISSQAGSNNIEVQECLDWQIGDKIVLGPSGTKWYYNEEKMIINKSGCILTLDSPLKYDYYGDKSITIIKNNIGQLDMRTLVVHLSRKIKIENPDQGGIIQIFHGLIENDIYIGQIRFQGVEIVNFGQLEKAGLIIENIFTQAQQTSSIIGCSFHESKGKFLRISNSNMVSVLNNIFYSGVKVLVEIVDQKYLIFKNNILIHVKRAISSDWAVLANFIFSKNNINILRQNLDISENIGQGSEDAGFYIVSSQCNEINQANIYNNVCSSAQNACFAVVQRSNICDAISYLYAYHSKIGIMFSVNSKQLEMKNFITAENKINIIMKGTSKSEWNNIMKINDGYITAVARPNCVQCYDNIDINYCSSTLGMQLATISSQSFLPTSYNLLSDQFDQIRSKQVIDLRVLITNLEFNQFKVNNNQVPNCVENAVFRQHPQAIDMTGRHYLKFTQCTECEFESLLYRLRDSDFNKIGIYGGCGSMECTGQKNVLIEDLTGDFFGEIGQGISNNTEFGQNVKYCKRIEQWNGYWCPGRNIQLLYFMSTAPDANTRLFSPVILSDGTFKNIINSCYEWNWLQSKPQMTRESKFISLISSNSTIIFNTTGKQPTASKFWLSKNFDDKGQDYAIISIKFDHPLIPSININGDLIPRNKIIDNECGSHKYSFAENLLEFIVTSQPDCYVDVIMKSYLEVASQFRAKSFLDCPKLVYAISKFAKIDDKKLDCSMLRNSTRRRLQESDIIEISFKWAIIDDAQAGTEAAYGSEERLSKYIDKLSQFTPNPDYGIYEILSQTYELHIVTELNFPSSEPTQLPDSSVSNPIIQINTNHSSYSDLDIMSLSENESVNQDTNNDKVIISKNPEPFDNNNQNQEQTLIIVLSITIPLVFIIAISIICIRRFKQRKSQVVIPISQIQQEDTTNNKLPENTTFMYRSAVKTPKAEYMEKIEFVTKI